MASHLEKRYYPKKPCPKVRSSVQKVRDKTSIYKRKLRRKSPRYYGSIKAERARNILNINLLRLLGARIPTYPSSIVFPPSSPNGYSYGIRTADGKHLVCRSAPGSSGLTQLPDYHCGELARLLKSNPDQFTHIYTDGSFYRYRNASGFAVFWGAHNELNAFGPVPSKGPLSSAKAEEYAIFLALLEIKIVTTLQVEIKTSSGNESQRINGTRRTDDLFEEGKDNDTNFIDLTGSPVFEKAYQSPDGTRSSNTIEPKDLPTTHSTMYCIHTDCSWALSDINRWYDRWKKPTCLVGWKTPPTPSTHHREILRVAAGLLWDLRQSGICILLRYVKGHAGIPGNEIADMMAKAGSNTGKSFGPQPILTQPRSTAKNSVVND